MPTLRMRNFVILQVAEGKQNAGTYYVRADVYDPKNGTAEYQPVTRFGKSFVNTIRAAFPNTGTYFAEDGTEQPWNGTNPNIPANTTREQMEAAIPMTFKRVLNARYVDVPLGGEYARLRGRDGVDRNGAAYKADDYILETDGTLKVYNMQRVLSSFEYNWVNATDANGRLIPNQKYREDPENEEPFEQTIELDENGVPVMHEAAGWESRPAAESIKQAFMVSIEKAMEDVKQKGHPEMIPWQYRNNAANPLHVAEPEPTPAPVQAAAAPVQQPAQQAAAQPTQAAQPGAPQGTVAF